MRYQRLSLIKASVGVLPIYLANCSGAMMETRPWPPQANGAPAPIVQGVPYFLPKAIIPITIVSSRGSSNTSSAPAAGAASPAIVAPKTSSAPSSTSKDNSATAGKPTTLLSVSAENVVDPTTADQEAKTPQFVLTASAAVPSFVPDYKQKYYLQYMIDNNSDATLSLHTDANGLLSTANGEYVDQTAAEAATLAQIAKTAATFSAGGGALVDLFIPYTPSPPPKKSTAVCLLPAVDRALSLSPGDNDGEDFNDSDRRLLSVGSNGGSTLTSVLTGGGGQQATITIQATLLNGSAYYKPQEGLVPQNGESPGVLFRDWQPWKIKIIVSPNPSAQSNCHIKESSSATVAMLPNGGAMFYVDVNREALIDKKVNLSVTNGMLTGVDISRPSPNLAALKLPLTILQPIVSLPFSAATSSSSHSSGNSSSTTPSLGGK